MRIIVCFIVLLFFSVTVQASEQKKEPCADAPFKVLDFWVGEWDLKWTGGTGSNSITKTYGGCVVNESFASSSFKGMSISMYNKSADQWRQTWMDDQGGFFDFYGHKEGDNYIFQTTPDFNKPQHKFRMIFTEVKSDSLTWTWQKTTNDGVKWVDMWKIYYSRKMGTGD